MYIVLAFISGVLIGGVVCFFMCKALTKKGKHYICPLSFSQGQLISKIVKCAIQATKNMTGIIYYIYISKEVLDIRLTQQWPCVITK